MNPARPLHPEVGPAAGGESPAGWTPDSWRGRPWPGAPTYGDAAALEAAVFRLRALPPLVTSGEIERLRDLIAQAQEGRRFLLQGGDCAETLADCRAEVIAAKLKILLQMSVVLAYAGKQPVVRVGRIAGQYAKPRSSPTETRAGTALPSYFGDSVNRAEFTPEGRRPDPGLLVEGYKHAALTLNFVRALLEAGLGDVHHPEYWDLGFLRHAGLTPELRARFELLLSRISEGLRFMEALGERTVGDLTGSAFFTSHEALQLHYDAAQTRTVPRRKGWYNLTTHLPWIGERTRGIDGAHVEYCRGLRNPIGVKVGPTADPAEIRRLLDVLNPAREAGKIVLITRLGAKHVREKLPPLVEGLREHPVLWTCDPMHGNPAVTPSGIKTRAFGEILDDLLTTWETHRACGSRLGGAHVELTGDDVTECLGGASNLTEADLSRNYASPCDPRLNYEQAMELAFALAERMQGASGADARVF